jgi:hypothetical protein
VPIVALPKAFLESSLNSHQWSEVRVQSRNDADIQRELASLFPRMRHLLVGVDGQPRWSFVLYRDSDETDLRYLPDDHVLDEDERLSLLPMVGC